MAGSKAKHAAWLTGRLHQLQKRPPPNVGECYLNNRFPLLAVRHNLAFRSKTSVDPSPLSSPLQGNVSPILSETQKKDASVNKLYSGVPSRSPQVVLGESHKVKGATPVIRVHPPPPCEAAREDPRGSW